MILANIDQAGRGIVVDGDSNGVGVNASPQSARWSNIISLATNGVDVYNFSRSGQTLQIIPGYQYLELPFIPVFDATKHTFLFLPIGTNDIPPVEGTVEGFISRMRVVLTDAIGKGWTYGKISMFTINYRGDLTTEQMGKLLVYNEAIRELASELGTVLIDIYDCFVNLPDPILSYFFTDKLHLINKGHTALADFALAHDMVPYNPIPPQPRPDFLIFKNFSIA